MEWCNQKEQPAAETAATAYKIIDFAHILDTNKHSLGSAKVEPTIGGRSTLYARHTMKILN